MVHATASRARAVCGGTRRKQVRRLPSDSGVELTTSTMTSGSRGYNPDAPHIGSRSQPPMRVSNPSDAAFSACPKPGSIQSRFGSAAAA